MKKYYVSYNTTYGDYATVWVMAIDAEEAKYIVKREYWDVDEIVSVREA